MSVILIIEITYIIVYDKLHTVNDETLNLNLSTNKQKQYVTLVTDDSKVMFDIQQGFLFRIVCEQGFRDIDKEYKILYVNNSQDCLYTIATFKTEQKAKDYLKELSERIGELKK